MTTWPPLYGTGGYVSDDADFVLDW
jgi:hypothetical protein